MDTGMSETLQKAMTKLVKDVSIGKGLVLYLPPLGSCT